MPSDATRQLVALAREGEKARRRIDGLEKLVQSLADSVTAGAGRSGPPSSGEGPRSWLLADDPDRAVDALTDLAVWVEQVYLRYAGAALPSCWAWHPDVVEELTWLRGAHAAAYATDGWQRVADWHDRHRPGVVTRIRRAAGDCELALHTEPAPATRTPLAHTTTEIAVSWTTEHRLPEPTDAQLDDARRYDRAQRSRTSR